MKDIAIQLNDSQNGVQNIDLKINVIRDGGGLITSGLVVGNVLRQNQAIIIIANPGEFPFSPTLGVAIDEIGLIQEEGIHVIRVKTLPLLNVNPIQKGIANVLLPFQYKKAIKKHFKSEALDLILMPTPPISLVDVASWLN